MQVIKSLFWFIATILFFWYSFLHKLKKCTRSSNLLNTNNHICIWKMFRISSKIFCFWYFKVLMHKNYTQFLWQERSSERNFLFFRVGAWNFFWIKRHKFQNLCRYQLSFNINYQARSSMHLGHDTIHYRIFFYF